MSELRQHAREGGRQAFAARYPHPFLFVTRDRRSDAARAFRTQDLSALDLDGEHVESSTEVFLVHRVGSDGTSMVTVGRAANMDIVLNSPSVSKLHAYFQRSIDGSGWTVADAGSRNGTALNGHALPVKDPRPIQSGDLIVFAEIFRGEFLSPEHAHERLRSS